MIILLYNYIFEFLLKMAIWTIHDSFCTTIGWYYIMKDIVNKTFYSYSGGVMPQLKAEYWCEEKECPNSA